MKASDIVKQLQAVLPKVTDLFSETLTVSSLTRSGTTVTAVTSTAHGLATNAVVNITGAQSPIGITSLTFLDGIATAVTASAHDLTEGWENAVANDNPDVTVSGATESEYNGANPLLSVPNRTTFTYTVTGTPTTPATGTPTLLEQFSAGYNGQHTITVIDTTTFTYDITQTPNSPAQGTMEAHKSVRVSGAVNIERAKEAYTKKAANKYWAIVILGDVAANKDRHVENDATAIRAAGTDARERLLTPFGVFVFAPATNEIAGMDARDSMEDVRPFLYKALLGVKFSTGLAAGPEYGVTSDGDSFLDYNGAVYIHQFVFSSLTDVIYNDGVDPDENVAFRDISLEFLDENDLVELSVTVNLDEEP